MDTMKSARPMKNRVRLSFHETLYIWSVSSIDSTSTSADEKALCILNRRTFITGLVENALISIRANPANIMRYGVMNTPMRNKIPYFSNFMRPSATDGNKWLNFNSLPKNFYLINPLYTL